MDPIRKDGIDFDLIVNVPVIFHTMAMMERKECTDREGYCMMVNVLARENLELKEKCKELLTRTPQKILIDGAKP